MRLPQSFQISFNFSGPRSIQSFQERADVVRIPTLQRLPIRLITIRIQRRPVLLTTINFKDVLNCAPQSRVEAIYIARPPVPLGSSSLPMRPSSRSPRSVLSTNAHEGSDLQWLKSRHSGIRSPKPSGPSPARKHHTFAKSNRHSACPPRYPIDR